jgi:hypothetical protein
MYTLRPAATEGARATTAAPRVLAPFAWCLLPFLLLATANSAGYRYGASDLAFYGPAVMRQLDPALFPHDAALIEAQARLTRMDETVAAIARATTKHLPTLFLVLYLCTLALLALAGSAIGNAIYRSAWATTALLAALTLRHAIPKSGTNTLEAYFHPRQVAFAFGALAVAAFLRGSPPLAALALTAAALFHPTTTLWFGIWLIVAALVAEPRWRRPLALLVAVTACAAVWALTWGPLVGRLVRMDAEWLDALAGKDYIFPARWSAATWLLNLAYAPIIVMLYRRRARAGLAGPRERGLVSGCLALVVVFLAALVLGAARVALAIQLQPARVFWLLDLLAIVYAIGAIAGAGGTRAKVAAITLLTISAARGLYIMNVEFPNRPLFEAAVPGDWGRVAAWAQTSTPRDAAWLADPAHASQYGTSVRMAAGRDVFVEATKDAAIGMYDRAIAIRTRDRLHAIGDFAALSPARARALSTEYDLEYLVTEHPMELPLAFQSGPLLVYRLR